MRDHLSDTTTYKSLTTSEIDRYSSDITKNILGWLKKLHKTLTKMERAFLHKKLKSNQSPYARFYLTLKAHKLKPGQTVDQLKSRPIVSCPGSLLHGLGVCVDRKLQGVAQRTVSYFKNTLELKKELLKLNLPRNARLSTADAVSMYTNIPTDTALNLIGNYLNQYQRNKEGTLSKSRRTRRLEEKQIKLTERSNKTKESLKKRSRQQPWRKKQTKPRKPTTSRRKKQQFQAKKHKQTSTVVTKQITKESTQLFWQEKTAKEATAKKLTAQFGFVGDPTLSK